MIHIDNCVTGDYQCAPHGCQSNNTATPTCKCVEPPAGGTCRCGYQSFNPITCRHLENNCNPGYFASCIPHTSGNGICGCECLAKH